MEFKFTGRNDEVRVKCSKILLKEIMMQKGDFKDIVLLFTWESIDRNDGLRKTLKYEIIPVTFPHDNVLNDEHHFILLEQWPNAWYTFRKNIDGVSISFIDSKGGKKLLDLEFTLIFDTQ